MASSYTWALVLLAAAAVSANLGNQITIDEVPSLAQVETRVLIIWTQTCAASIITNIHLIAPASCFSGPLYAIENRQVIVGSSTRSNEEADTYRVANVINHPSFGELGRENDISIIRLESYLTFSNLVQQVQILGEGIDLPDHLQLRLAGWGNTAQGSDTYADNNLYSLNLYTINNDDCLEKYLVADEPEIITENMVCAGFINSGRDFDVRDTGAPLTYNNVLVGIIAFGDSDADDTMPLVSTAISSYTNWIVENAV